jgi:hypothetical protein
MTIENVKPKVAFTKCGKTFGGFRMIATFVVGKIRDSPKGHAAERQRNTMRLPSMVFRIFYWHPGCRKCE